MQWFALVTMAMLHSGRGEATPAPGEQSRGENEARTHARTMENLQAQLEEYWEQGMGDVRHADVHVATPPDGPHGRQGATILAMVVQQSDRGGSNPYSCSRTCTSTKPHPLAAAVGRQGAGIGPVLCGRFSRTGHQLPLPISRQPNTDYNPAKRTSSWNIATRSSRPTATSTS